MFRTQEITFSRFKFEKFRGGGPEEYDTIILRLDLPLPIFNTKDLFYNGIL
jgi:hypothetical protein